MPVTATYHVLERSVLNSRDSMQLVRRTARARAADEPRRREVKNARTFLPKARSLGITHLRSEGAPQPAHNDVRNPAIPGKNVVALTVYGEEFDLWSRRPGALAGGAEDHRRHADPREQRGVHPAS